MLGWQLYMLSSLYLTPPPQVVDKSRYASGDNSLEREIRVLSQVSALHAWLGRAGEVAQM